MANTWEIPVFDIQIRLAIEQLNLVQESYRSGSIEPNLKANLALIQFLPHKKLAQRCKALMAERGNPSGFYWKNSGKEAAIEYLEQVLIHGFDGN